MDGIVWILLIVDPSTSTECKAVFANCKTEKLTAEYSETRYVRTIYSKPKAIIVTFVKLMKIRNEGLHIHWNQCPCALIWSISKYPWSTVT